MSQINNKKAIFIGNSFIYFGGIVRKGDTRDLDYGLFNRIAATYGDDVPTIDCTYGGHHFYDFTPAGCKTDGCDGGIGSDLLRGVDLGDIDLVFLSESGDNNKNFLADITKIMHRFTKPGVKFFYLVHNFTYTKNHFNILDHLPGLHAMGVTIIDWGHLCFDLFSGNVSIPGSDVEYTKNTFVNFLPKDKHHPNPLAGYVAALMCYCAASGASAVGQDYSLIRDAFYAGGNVTFEDYIGKYYEDETSNYKDVVASPADMLGLQKLCDAYINYWNH